MTDRFSALSKQLSALVTSSPRPEVTERAIGREIDEYSKQVDSDVLVLSMVLRGRGIEPAGGEAS
jgi:hypothetical protein